MSLGLNANVALNIHRVGEIGRQLLAGLWDLDEFTTTPAPSTAKRRAMAAPMPLVEPVTIATRPAKSGINDPPCSTHNVPKVRPYSLVLPLTNFTASRLVLTTLSSTAIGD